MIVSALLAPFILGCAGLAIDLGFAVHQRGQAQNAADAAALAGADVLLNGGTTDAAQNAALTYAENNGYQSAEITVQIPPQTGPHAGQSGYVAVLVQHVQSTLFVRALHINSIDVTARAVAGFKPIPQNYALVLLDKTMCPSYDQTSSSTLNIVGGGLMDNASCQPSGYQTGGSTLNADVINYYSSGSWSLGNNNATTSVPPAPISLQIADPLASLAAPTLGTPAQGSCIPGGQDSTGTASNPKGTNVQANSNNPVTLCPGTYYGGLKISGSNGSVTFAPGTYIFAGGGLAYSGGSTISGSGVTFYNTCDPSPCSPNPNGSGAGACGGISITGSGLIAPTAGPYANMLFWQDPTCTQAMKYAGSSNTSSDGVIYLPTAQLEVTGGGALGALQIIVDSFKYSGNANVTINYADYVQLFQPEVALVE